jgi:beta-phosphoglucomutase-like phosphatase (HAD superfamily)
MAMRTRRLRLTGHGRRVHLRTLGDWTREPMDGIAECCRALMATEKALGESIRRARSAGHPWAEIGRTLGATGSAASFDDVVDALATQRRATWKLLWGERTTSA